MQDIVYLFGVAMQIFFLFYISSQLHGIRKAIENGKQEE